MPGIREVRSEAELRQALLNATSRCVDLSIPNEIWERSAHKWAYNWLGCLAVDEMFVWTSSLTTAFEPDTHAEKELRFLFTHFVARSKLIGCSFSLILYQQYLNAWRYRYLVDFITVPPYLADLLGSEVRA